MNINQYNPKGKIEFLHLLSLEQVQEEEICEILHLTRELKNKHFVQEKLSCLKGKYVLLISKNDMIRTSIAFQIAVDELGGKAVVVSQSGEKLEAFLSDGDYIRAIAKNSLSAVVVGTSKFEDCKALESNCKLPIINANCFDSPIETLSVLYTVWESLGSIGGLNITIVGDANSTSNCLLLAFIKMGANVTLVTPDETPLPKEINEYCSQYGDVKITDILSEGVKNADVIFIKGGEISTQKYALSEKVLSLCKENVKIMSCMPKDKNILPDFISSGSNSLLDEQTENIVHTEKAVLSLLIGKKNLL